MRKTPFSGLFLSTAGNVSLPELARLRLLHAKFLVDFRIVEMRQGRLSITKSPWFDFFTASERNIGPTPAPVEINVTDGFFADILTRFWPESQLSNAESANTRG
jgi:hypothetical protein